MTGLARAIFVCGALHVSLWAWGPVVARWQTRHVLARYGGLDALEVAMQVHHELMLAVYIEAGIVGVLLLVASSLVFMHRKVGWHLWVGCLALSLGSVIMVIGFNGASVGAIGRLVVLAVFAVISFRAHRSDSFKRWFRRHGTRVNASIGGRDHEPAAE